MGGTGSLPRTRRKPSRLVFFPQISRGALPLVVVSAVLADAGTLRATSRVLRPGRTYSSARRRSRVRRLLRRRRCRGGRRTTAASRRNLGLGLSRGLTAPPRPTALVARTALPRRNRPVQNGRPHLPICPFTAEPLIRLELSLRQTIPRRNCPCSAAFPGL